MEYDNLFEDSYYWPKPKGRWLTTFERERKQVVRLEAVFYGVLDKYHKTLAELEY
jgi:hypothetical protein